MKRTLPVVVLLLLPFSITTFAQETEPLTEPEIRGLLKQRQDKDLKVSYAAGEALSKLDARSIPALIEITKKGTTCERLEAAAIIVTEFDHNNKEVIPSLVDLAKGGSIFSSEKDLMCRRGAAFLLAWSSEGIRILAGFLKDQDMFVRRSAIFAFYEHTEGDHFPGDSTQAWKEAIPMIVETSKDEDEILSRTADTVLDRFIAWGGEELSSATKKAMGQEH